MVIGKPIGDVWNLKIDGSYMTSQRVVELEKLLEIEIGK